MLYKKEYIVYTICILYSCFCLTGCQIYPLYYHKAENNKTYINQITVSVSTDFCKKEMSRYLNFSLSHVLTKNKYILVVKLNNNQDSFISTEHPLSKTGSITINASYTLIDISKKNILYKGQSNTTSLFDFSNQQFAEMSIIKDIEKKSIVELAENISIDVISFIKSIDQ